MGRFSGQSVGAERRTVRSLGNVYLLKGYYGMKRVLFLRGNLLLPLSIEPLEKSLSEFVYYFFAICGTKTLLSKRGNCRLITCQLEDYAIVATLRETVRHLLQGGEFGKVGQKSRG